MLWTIEKVNFSQKTLQLTGSSSLEISVFHLHKVDKHTIPVSWFLSYYIPNTFKVKNKVQDEAKVPRDQKYRGGWELGPT